MENSALWAAKRPLKEDEIWVTGNMHSPALRCWNWNALNGGFHVNIRPLQRDTHSARPTRAAGALGSDPLALMNLTLSDYKAPDSPCLLHVPVFVRLEGRDRGSRYHFEKLSFIWVQGAQVKMPFLQHALGSQLESLVVEQVVPALLDQGFFYVDHFLGDIAGHMVWVRSNACITPGFSTTGSWPDEATEFAGEASEEIK